ncbi:group II intron reverse transcriptase/maturase, partial [Enterococcus faecalis]|nr:group II intron reverse transcriptase/maturase [Enterococcus faecalis]
LDMYVEEYKSKFDKGKEREKDSEYKNIYNKICTRQKKLTKLKINDEKYEEMLSEIKDLKKKMHEISEVNQIDKEYRRLYYTRYADDFIIGLIGSKEEAIKIKDDIEKFLKSKLDIVLSGEKRCITHSNKFVHFLGYNIAISRKNDGKKTFKSSKKKIRNLQCELYLSQDIWIKKLKELGIFRIKKDGTWIAKPRLYLMNLSDAEILNIYNNEIRGLYNYYKLAKNISVLKHFVYYMKYSLYMTLTSKYNSSISRIIRKYSFQGTFRVSYRTNTEEKYLYLYNKKFKMDFCVNKNSKVDTIATNYQYCYSTKLTQRYYQTSLNSIKRQKEQ